MSGEQSKLQLLILYLCATVPNRLLGKTKLNKMLYFADRDSMIKYGKPISDDVYIKKQFGPVPRGIDRAIEHLEKSDFLIARKAEPELMLPSPTSSYEQWEFIVLVETARILQWIDQVFTPTEISIIDSIREQFVYHTGSALSNLSHDELWQIAEMGEEIPYEAMLIGERLPMDEYARALLEEVASQYQSVAA